MGRICALKWVVLLSTWQVAETPALAEHRAALEAEQGQYKVVGAGTPTVDGMYRDDKTLQRPPAGMLDFAPVPQFRKLALDTGGHASTLLLRRQGPHWWIVDAPSGLDLQKTVDEECYERGDETWYYYNYSRGAAPPTSGWRAKWGLGIGEEPAPVVIVKPPDAQTEEAWLARARDPMRN
jgi:hypothetical protein